MGINQIVAATAISIGVGHRQMEEIVGAFDIPFMTFSKFKKCEDEVGDTLHSVALTAMKEAADEEACLAREKNEVDSNGVPLITVVADGSWAKRSYRTKYDSLSGMAAIMGCRTGKVLYIGVRNKFCVTCAKAETKGATPKPHDCYKNWSGTSSGMEASVIVNGFKTSMEYGLIYNKLVADGDSSVYNQILKSRPYRDVGVEKIECFNHLPRNYCRNLRDLGKNRHAGPKVLRDVIVGKVKKLRSAVNQASIYWKSQSNGLSERIAGLRADIVNSPLHVFGDHAKCNAYFCSGAKEGEVNIVPSLRACGLWSKVTGIVAYLAVHSKSIIQRLNSNIVENFNSLIAKMIGGKRVNFYQSRSYQNRCMGAVVSHSKKRLMYSITKAKGGHSPGVFTKRMESRRLSKLRWQRINRSSSYRKRNTGNSAVKADSHYGENAEKPDMEESEYLLRQQEILNSLQLQDDEKKKLEEVTREQSNCELWKEERRKRITSSNFGVVCRRRPTTSCVKLVSALLYSNNIDSNAMLYGRATEKEAIDMLEQKMNIKVDRCGLFIDDDHPFLGATPDGLVGVDKIVEIKCPYSARDMSPIEAVISKKFNFWSMVGDERIINKNHHYYYQIQGQLHVTKRASCIFVLYTKVDPFITHEEIFRDDSFWSQSMESKLIRFYMDCILPELTDPRHTRSMTIRNPSYVEEAILQVAGKKRKVNEPLDI